ncbi:Inner centromere protein [Frankliniella fusca]|uniref:Inner centromere protein n=1 Tax=Frankliniella fusca TaxID=407009 RepID=A0AAE1I1V4_9NEOP|nr:Inner centromere protein [Frankliniella fusca]
MAPSLLEEKISLALREQAKKSLAAYNKEFEEHYGWLTSVVDGLKNGTINAPTVLVPKTPGKRQIPLAVINESPQSSFEHDVKPIRTSAQNKKGKGRPKKGTAKKAPTIEEEDDFDFAAPAKPQKRLSEEAVHIASKRLCGNRTSETTSRDSGLSSVGSRNTQGRSSGGFVVKQEVLTPKTTSTDSTVSVGDEAELVDVDSSPAVSRDSPTLRPSKKRSRSTGRGAAIKTEPRRSSRCYSEPRTPTRTPNAKRPSTGTDKTVIVLPEAQVILSPYRGSPLLSPKYQGNFRSPIIKAPPPHLLKGESVKKTVKAFEALNEEHETEVATSTTTVTLMPPPSKLLLPPKTTTTTTQSSLDDALNAPTRVTRTKTRAMAKAAADETKKSTTGDHSLVAVSKELKSPTHYHQKNPLPNKTIESRVDDRIEKENINLTHSRIVTKPFGSASKQPQLFLKATTPLRMTPLTQSFSASSSFTAPRIGNLVTSVESFIPKQVVNQEVKSSREENLQKLVAKAEVASKKKEELMKAQLEERIKKRQEKRLKVCAAREAMEKEKLEMQQKLEREREEKQRQLQAEREEKLRQEYLKRKRLAQLKAAETEERRRQEEAARLAKLKQQEEEQKRAAAQRKKEQEEAEKRQQERMQQEREAAAHRAKEAERLAKEASLMAKKTSKVQLDQTYDKLSGPQSYGMTPGDERVPIPITNPDNYGIEDAGTDDSSEDEAKPKKVVPLWAQPKNRIHKLLEDYEINHNQMFAFFGSKKSTPDLSKIFVAIDKRQLIRKSSAVWRTPPVKH